MDPAYLDSLRPWARHAMQTVHQGAPKASLWVGEAGGAYNSGRPGATNAFMSAFWYLDSMATVAQLGHAAFCRQALVGGNYGLLDAATGLVPNPDFYAALLWTRLMGPQVLGAARTGGAAP